MRIINWIVLLGLSLTVPCQAEEEVKKAKEHLKEEKVVTHHVLQLSNGPLAYKAEVGNLIQKNEEGEEAGSIYYISYEREGVEEQKVRPIAFIFNGGPGASSVWLHLGVLGPKKVGLDEFGYPLPCCELSNNPGTLLEVADLVFIDPVSTGFSRPASKKDEKQFHGVKEDIESISEFIRLYLSQHSRWASPKYLIGESYGVPRAIGIVETLRNQHRADIDGLVLVAGALNDATYSFDMGNDLPYITFLPSYAATAFYHKKLAPLLLEKTVEELTREVEDFALGDYALALLQGDQLPKEKKKKVVQKLAYYTGLSKEYLEKANLRVHCNRFFKELLREENRTVGGLDGRFLGTGRDTIGSYNWQDPALDAITGSFTNAMNHYLSTDLKVNKSEEYRVFFEISPWSYKNAQNRYWDVGESLRESISRNPQLRAFIAGGYYDLVIPYSAMNYGLSHLQLDPFLKENITMNLYEAGHMMYLHQPSLDQFQKDLKEFFKNEQLKTRERKRLERVS